MREAALAVSVPSHQIRIFAHSIASAKINTCRLAVNCENAGPMFSMSFVVN
jgi:hypothetical protein